MLGDQVIADEPLHIVEDGVAFRLRMPWYRALPLSCLEGLEVRLDGSEVPSDDIALSIGGQTYRLAELPPLHDTWWHVTDAIEVTVTRAQASQTDEHELDVTVALRIPYIVESGHPLVMRERCVKQMAVEQ